MNQTTELLARVAENARTGRNATDQLLKRVDDESMRAELTTQRDFYSGAEQNAVQKLGGFDEKAPWENPVARAGMWAGIRMNTAFDKSNSNLADIVIQGATMGVIDTTKARNEFPDAGAEAQDAASAFITQQQDAIERMKNFLM
ncbi:MAG: hypothetical protein ACOYI5_08595 [Christensenellales bacterium]|jgi:hypothetical protein